MMLSLDWSLMVVAVERMMTRRVEKRKEMKRRAVTMHWIGSSAKDVACRVQIRTEVVETTGTYVRFLTVIVLVAVGSPISSANISTRVRWLALR